MPFRSGARVDQAGQPFEAVDPEPDRLRGRRGVCLRRLKSVVTLSLIQSRVKSVFNPADFAKRLRKRRINVEGAAVPALIDAAMRATFHPNSQRSRENRSCRRVIDARFAVAAGLEELAIRG
jgi:hypothetical protein